MQFEQTLNPAECFPLQKTSSDKATESYHSRTLEAMRSELVDLIKNERITPHYQAIVDCYSMEIIGYELLSRGVGHLTAPDRMFSLAATLHMSWELERACRKAALQSISRLDGETRRKKFFLNVSPRIFNDPRFSKGFTREKLVEYGLDQRRILLEITEVSSINDYQKFEEIINYYVGQGFQIALDDFGAGHSSLVTLIAASPHFIKLDRQIISGIDHCSYKQHLVKSMVHFVAHVDSRLIAEGVETVEELKTLLRLGIRFAQGFYFQRPEARPVPLSSTVRDMLKKEVVSYQTNAISPDLTVRSMTLMPPTVTGGSTTCEEMDIFFQKNEPTDHVVVVEDDERPTGLITRHHFHTMTSGRFGFSLWQKRSIRFVTKQDMLAVGEDIDLSSLGKMAMDRDRDDLYDPAVVVDHNGRLVGTITMRDLLSHTLELEVKLARDKNPLTGLPGNVMIHTWIRTALENPPFTIIYGDLDFFKSYNDTYGFSQGDELIKLTATVLTDHLKNISPRVQLGHVGGDDFMIVVIGDEVAYRPLQQICREFDQKKMDMFDACDRNRGFYTVTDRRGDSVNAPLVTLSLAAVTADNISECPHPGRLGHIQAQLKKKVKAMNMETGKSGVIIDKRLDLKN